MISRLNRYVLLALTISIAVYIVVVNWQTVTVQFGGSYSFSTALGVVLLLTFAVGFGCALLIGSLFAFRSWLRERSLKQRDQEHDAFLRGLLDARAASALGELERARAAWESLLRKDHTFALVHLELSNVFEAQGDLEQAQAQLEQARQALPQNSEVLMRAATLALKRGNRTVALDNLNILADTRPCKQALTLGLTVAEEAGLYNKALDYLRRLESLGERSEPELSARLLFKKLAAEASNSKDYLTELRELVRKHPAYSGAFEELSRRELELGDVDAAAQALLKAAKLSAAPALWHRTSTLWLKQGQPERALACARSACKETRGQVRLKCEFQLAQLYVNLSMFADCEALLAKLPEVAREQGVTLSPEQEQQCRVLGAICALQRAQPQRALEVLCQLPSNANVSSPRLSGSSHSNATMLAPSPALSTP
jgi:tetratricopeptide (TPR) repeat protein